MVIQRFDSNNGLLELEINSRMLIRFYLYRVVLNPELGGARDVTSAIISHKFKLGMLYLQMISRQVI